MSNPKYDGQDKPQMEEAQVAGACSVRCVLVVLEAWG